MQEGFTPLVGNRAFVLRALTILVTLALCWSSAVYADDSGGAAPPPSPALSAIKPEFFVSTYEASAADAGTSAILSLGVERELSKQVNAHISAASAPWIIPEPQWSSDELARRCATDPNAIGGVAITYYTGEATHFYLLWQSETTTLDLFAEVIACNHNVTKPPPATGIIVATISELPGANGTDWLVRRTQVSVPLITLAGIGAAFAKGSTSTNSSSVSTKGTTTTTTTNNSTTGANVSSGVLVGSIFNQASNRDIPGYSDPVRLRHAAQHVGVDVIFAMNHFCNPAQGEPAPNDQLATICKALGFST
jgi:hypothetical protein